MNEPENNSNGQNNEPLTTLRHKNRRAVQILVGVIAVVVIFSIFVRLFQFLRDRPPKIPPTSKVIPGYYKEEDVAAFIKTGMLYKAVVEKYGSPENTITDSDGYAHHFWHATEPRKRFIYDYAFSGFVVDEKDGVILGWAGSHTSTQR